MEKRAGGAVVDRHDQHAGQEAPPEGDDPLGAVLTPDDHLVTRGDTFGGEARCDVFGRPSDIPIAEVADPVAVVVDEELVVGRQPLVEEVEQSVPRHGGRVVHARQRQEAPTLKA